MAFANVLFVFFIVGLADYRITRRKDLKTACDTEFCFALCLMNDANQAKWPYLARGKGHGRPTHNTTQPGPERKIITSTCFVFFCSSLLPTSYTQRRRHCCRLLFSHQSAGLIDLFC